MTSPQTFHYNAQTAEGEPFTGTLEARDGEEARAKLTSLGLQLSDLVPAALRPRRVRPIRGEDLMAFNQHLAQLTEAGMPVEQGLRLIAQDMRRGRLARAIGDLSNELERGTPLAQAFAVHRRQFPPLYARLIDAGVQTSNLPAMLMNLGRYHDLILRLRGVLWQAVAYPAMILGLLLLLAGFLSFAILPTFRAIFEDFHTEMPGLTLLVLQLGELFPAVLLATGLFTALALVAWGFLRFLRQEAWVVEHLISALPLIGPLLRRSATARWCDALRLGLEAGLPLPEAAALAGDAVGWSRLQAEGRHLAQAVTTGQSLETTAAHRAAHYRTLPAHVQATLQLAHDRNHLPLTLASLSAMYHQLAQARLVVLQSLLTPLLVLGPGLLLFLMILALFMPLISLMRSVM